MTNDPSSHDTAEGKPDGGGWPVVWTWLLFALQVLAVVMVEVANDIVRGNFWRPNLAEALGHARAVATFEEAHDLFIEPGVQAFFQRPHELLGWMLTWPQVVEVANNVYAFCHIFVSLGVAIWVFAKHRPRFPLLRNIMLLTNFLALVGYELFPMAPPRLTTGLMLGRKVVHFQDTMNHVLGTGTLNGTPIGYNAFSAMPSLHVAWAIVMAGTVFLLTRHLWIRAIALTYPILMTWTVVVTANHYVMDAVGAAVDVALATVLCFAAARVIQHLRGQLVPLEIGNVSHPSHVA